MISCKVNLGKYTVKSRQHTQHAIPVVYEALLGVLGSREHRGKTTGSREMMKWNLGVI